MKLSNIVLVHTGRKRGKKKPLFEAATDGLEVLRKKKPALATAFAEFKPTLRRMLFETAAPGVTSARSLMDALPSLTRLAKTVGSAPKLTVGLWDLGARVGRLPRVLENMNRSQTEVTFFEVQAAMPAGMTSRPERVVRWAEEFQGERMSDEERAFVKHNVIADHFFPRADAIRKDLGLDYLAGITPQMVAGRDDDDDTGEEWIYWNHFSSWEGRIVLASTHGVREYSQAAGRPFEASVAGIVLSSLLSAASKRIRYHAESTGCLFDYNENRDSIVESLRRARIDPTCRDLIAPRLREAATHLVATLNRYRGRKD